MNDAGNKLTQNMLNLYGEKGKAWLANLPIIIKSLSDYWKLTDLTPVNNMTYHYVAKAKLNKGHFVVIKIGYDEKSLSQEKVALEYFNGEAVIQLLDYNKAYNALLLAQAVPGESLKSHYPKNIEFVMDCYVGTMQKLHEKHLPIKNPYPHIGDWLKAMDTVRSEQLPGELLEKSIYLKNVLLDTIVKPIFLHGDLHHDNILQNGNLWVAIDPKGIVGDAEFEMAAFDFIHQSELENNNIKEIFAKRLNQIAQKSHLDATRIKHWVLVRLILSAVWSIEDNDDPSWAINLAKKLFDTFTYGQSTLLELL